MLLLFLDAEKAFDRIECGGVMKVVLDKMGFGLTFVLWITIIYSQKCAVISVEGFLSKAFFLFRGLRHGYPLSLCFLTSL